MSKQIYKNTGVLTRFMIKKDWIRIPVWLVSITFITLLTASAFTSLYQSDQERQAIAETMMNPAMTAMVGESTAEMHQRRTCGSKNFTIDMAMKSRYGVELLRWEGGFCDELAVMNGSVESGDRFERVLDVLVLQRVPL